jgi:hypothetical protein
MHGNERNIIEIEQQLYRTVDSLERKSLLGRLTKELDIFARRDPAFITKIEQHVVIVSERFKKQKNWSPVSKLTGTTPATPTFCSSP